MAYPKQTPLILICGLGIPESAFEQNEIVFGDDDDGEQRFLKWDTQYGPRPPTEEDVAAAARQADCIAAVAAKLAPAKSTSEEIAELKARVAALEGR